MTTNRVASVSHDRWGLKHCDVSRRHDFMYLMSVSDGNPNGDPDSDNAPRQDQQTRQGLMSDVCVKRKVRDAVEQMQGEREGYRIYIQNDGIALNAKLREANGAINGVLIPNAEEVVVSAPAAKGKGGKKSNGGTGTAESRREQAQARCKWMYEQYYDVRTFGAVMSTGDYPAAQVHGPVQLTMARSIDPIYPMDISITRVSITKENEDKLTTSTMGRKWVVPYGLYIGYGYFSPSFAEKSGFSGEDLSLFWEAFIRMWENDHSAARGRLGLHGLYVFSHDSARGNAADHTLFSRIQVQRKPEVTYSRSFEDYSVTVDEDNLPGEIKLTRLVG